MGVYIEGIEMPKEGTFNIICIYSDGHVSMPSWGKGLRIVQGINAVSVPVHGRLIDADALHKLFEDQWHYLQVLDWNENPTAEPKQSGINWCINTMHDDAPTIIPASEESET